MAQEHAAETVEETVEAPALEAVEQNDEPTLGWDGKPFDPERAQRTIANIRAERDEWRTKASESESEEYFRTLAEKFGYELPEDEPEYEESADPNEARLNALEQAEIQRREAAVFNDLSNHIDTLSTDSELKLSDKAKEWITLSSIHAGGGEPTPEGTEQAFTAMREFLEEHGKAEVDKYLKSKRAPTPPAAGSSGQPAGDFDPKSDKSRIRRMAAVAQARIDG